MSKKSRKKPTWKWHVDHPLGGPTRVVCGKPLPKTLFIVQFTSISLRLFSDIQSHVCVMHEISHLFLIMFCIWTLMFHLISYVGSYGNACSRFQLMSLLDSRKSGTFLMVSCTFCRYSVVVYCWLFIYSFEHIFGFHIFQVFLCFFFLCQQMDEQFKTLIVLSHYLEVHFCV